MKIPPLLISLLCALPGSPCLGKALPSAVKNMEDREYENYLHHIYLKHYRDPVPYGVWSGMVNSLSSKSHKLKYKDTLWDMSKTFFKDHLLWSRLWVANHHIDNPHRIQQGDSINFDAKALKSNNRFGVNIRSQFPNVKIPPPLHQKRARSAEQIPSSLPFIKEGIEEPPETAFSPRDIQPDKTALLPFYLSERDLSGEGRVESKDGYGLVALNGEDIIISYDGEVITGEYYTVFENRGPPVSSFFGLLNLKGYEIAVKGSIKITGYVQGSERLYRARVTQSLAPIQRGHKIMKGSAPIYTLSQKGSKGSAKGQIISSPNTNQKWLGVYSLAYLDKGFSNGVQVGDIYHVKLKQKNHFPYSYEQPDIGAIRVVHANPDTSTAIVAQARDIISIGDFFEPGAGAVEMETAPDHEIVDEPDIPEPEDSLPPEDMPPDHETVNEGEEGISTDQETPDSTGPIDEEAPSPHPEEEPESIHIENMEEDMETPEDMRDPEDPDIDEGLELDEELEEEEPITDDLKSDKKPEKKTSPPPSDGEDSIVPEEVKEEFLDLEILEEE